MRCAVSRATYDCKSLVIAGGAELVASFIKPWFDSGFECTFGNLSIFSPLD